MDAMRIGLGIGVLLAFAAVPCALADEPAVRGPGDPSGVLGDCTGKFTLGWASNFVHVEIPPGALEGITIDNAGLGVAFITYDHQVRDENTNELKEVWYRVLGHTTEIDCPFLGDLPCPNLSNGAVMRWTNETLAWVEDGPIGLPPALPDC